MSSPEQEAVSERLDATLLTHAPADGLVILGAELEPEHQWVIKHLLTKPFDLELWRAGIGEMPLENQRRVVFAVLERTESMLAYQHREDFEAEDRETIDRMRHWGRMGDSRLSMLMETLMLKLKKLIDEALARRLLDHLDHRRGLALGATGDRWLSAFLRGLKVLYAKQPVPADMVGRLDELRDRIGDWDTTARRLRKHLDALIVEEVPVAIVLGEAWADAAHVELEAMEPARRSAWSLLLAHAQSASSAKPSKSWAKQAATHLEAVGHDDFVEIVARWFGMIDLPRPKVDESLWHQGMMYEANIDFLKGLCWMASVAGRLELARPIAQVVRSAYQTVPGVGLRATRLGNAGVYALGQLPGPEAVGQLAILKVKVKPKPAQAGIEKAFVAAAQREGLPRDEIEEMIVPQYGMSEVGVREEKIGGFTARLDVHANAKTELKWIKSDGMPQKSVPQAVKDGFAGDLKELKSEAKEIQKMLAAQRERLDQLFIARKTWDYPTWVTRYLDHVLVGLLARKLIWVFSDKGKEVAGAWHDDALRGVDGRLLAIDPASTTVALWHPMGCLTDEVLAWRERMEQWGVAQPFKQAHREIYLLADAEKQAGVYSNRFSMHILKQFQFHALCRACGWDYRMASTHDFGSMPASRKLPQWGLRAEYWIDGVGDRFGIDTSDIGAYLYLSTDQVRFYRIDDAPEETLDDSRKQDPREPIPLDQIDPLVFSEVMRDVDLFVGVTSVGNDPNWQDGGPEGRYRDYWHSYSFGDLGATSKTRKDILERLVPRLKIAERCSFDDKFLIVRGDRRTYKIHLGSSNILMEPNDQYLCIVPGRGDTKLGDKVFLPFEGDQRLAVILSKAMMLAEDTKIKDPTILSQIKR